MTVKLRYKKPEQHKSRLIVVPVDDRKVALSKTSDNFRFSSAVAGFGMILRDSKFRNGLQINQVLALAKDAGGKDENKYREEFISMIEILEY